MIALKGVPLHFHAARNELGLQCFSRFEGEERVLLAVAHEDWQPAA